MQKRPLILVCNDDGINALGIRSLIDVAEQFGEVVVVAPDKPQSGMGHAVTVNATLRITELPNTKHKEYSCTGTPVDCVKLATKNILKRKPDLVVSGINHGKNSAINVIYSGTMSAAVEAAIENIPAIGFSLCDYDLNADFSAAKKIAATIIDAVLNKEQPQHLCLNVNIPKLPYEQIKGIKICRQANAIWEEDFQERIDPMGRPYYWLTGNFVNLDKGEDTDEWALANSYVSVVPVQFDMTAYHQIKHIQL